MQTKLSPRLLAFANKVAKIKYLKSLLKPFYYPYKERIQRNRRSQFHKYGLSILEDFDRIMTSNGFSYFVFAGTLLGAVREKGFIKHDLDIDVAMFNDDYSPELEQILVSNGFSIKRRFEIENGKYGREETYEKNNVSLDIFYIYSDEKYPTYQCDFSGVLGTSSPDDSMEKYGYVRARRIEFPISRKVARVPFETIMVNAPENYDEWLRCRYGDDYMIPNPNFHDTGKNPHMFQWEGVKASFRRF